MSDGKKNAALIGVTRFRHLPTDYKLTQTEKMFPVCVTVISVVYY